MAKVRVKGLNKAIKSISKKTEKSAADSLVRNGQTVENEIIITILNGQSPVKGKRFQKYSKRYADKEKGGQLKPVNMHLSGDMLDSLELKKSGSGVSIEFKSSIAKFHDILGAGKSKVIRRLLPKTSKGETFKENILREIRKAIRKGFK